MDVDSSSGLLETPSLTTPNIRSHPLIYKIQESYPSADIANEENHTTDCDPCFTMPTMKNDESSSLSSNEIKLSKIENDLMQSFTQSRRPTESIFQKMAKAGVLNIQNVSVSHTNDDGMPLDIPSTAEVVNDIESFDKYSVQDNTERETATSLTSDNNHFDPLVGHNMGVIISPKKKFLQRSKSQTEAASPPPPPPISNNQFSQLQKTNFDDGSSTDDDHQSGSSNDYQRLSDIPLSMHAIDSNPQLDNSVKPSYTLQFQTTQDGVHPTLIKQHPTMPTNKRTFQQTIVGTQMPKSNSTVIIQQPVTNEVTSSNQLIGAKRQKVTPTKSNTTTSFLSTLPIDDNNKNLSDDQRKRQIRDSNREAARRCRERRRNYIEQLEGNLEQCKQQIKQLNDKLSQAERENTQLRAIITEAKLFHPATCLSSNESIVEFTTVIPTNGMEIHGDSTDGNILQRTYFTRSTR